MSTHSCMHHIAKSLLRKYTGNPTSVQLIRFPLLLLLFGDCRDHPTHCFDQSSNRADKELILILPTFSDTRQVQFTNEGESSLLRQTCYLFSSTLQPNKFQISLATPNSPTLIAPGGKNRCCWQIQSEENIGWTLVPRRTILFIGNVLVPDCTQKQLQICASNTI